MTKLPSFNSDRMLEQGYYLPDRVSVPISDREAHITYYLVCRQAEKAKWQFVFHDLSLHN